MKRLLHLLRCDRGSVESALVLVPLMLLFLAGMQIATAAHTRNVEKIDAQNSASTRAISGEFESGDEFIHIDSSGDGQNLDLLITRRRSSLTDLLPGFLGGGSSGREVTVDGMAIVENQR